MKDPIQRYLDKRADLTTRPLESNATEGINAVVVIPALAEEENLQATLDSLAENPVELLSSTLIIVVVNNRSPEIATPDHIENNQHTLQQLRQRISDSTSPLRLAIIDASSPGNELAHKEGVGAARKIGLDHALAILHQNKAQPATLICLDADTLVEPNYLEIIAAHFAQPHAWAAVIDYAHRLEGTDDQQRAITDYEAFLRYHEAGLRYAASPYAFHTIGSTMACTAQAYAAISGMNKKQAGEDFYFLQEMAKTGTVHPIHGTIVHPSSRQSWRVPFGTGKRMAQLMTDPQAPFPAYHPQSYQILKQWLQAVTQVVTESQESHCGTAALGCDVPESPPAVAGATQVAAGSPDPGAYIPYGSTPTPQGSPHSHVVAEAPDPATYIPYGSTLLTQAHQIHPQLAAYLQQEQFEKNWTRLQKNAPNPDALHQQFHRWFDALKTLRLIHHLRDTTYPEQELHQAIQDLLFLLGKKKK